MSATYNSVVLAADGVSVASAATADADDTDWGAAKAKKSLNGAEDDPEQACEEVRLRGGALRGNLQRLVARLEVYE